MSIHGQTIEGPDGYLSIDGCSSRQDAVFKAVDMAIASGWSPPKWWQRWRWQWPEDCRAEYERRICEGDKT